MTAPLRMAVHAAIGSRRSMNRRIRRFAEGLRGARILELGSGKSDAYSVRRFFHPSNMFVRSDVDPSFGHQIVDVTTMEFDEEFEVILCLNVLEHVYDHVRAVDRVYRALKPGGTALIAVPVMFPLHDEPIDYWRFTEHSLRRLLERFASVEIAHRGARRYPFSYFVRARKEG